MPIKSNGTQLVHSYCNVTPSSYAHKLKGTPNQFGTSTCGGSGNVIPASYHCFQFDSMLISKSSTIRKLTPSGANIILGVAIGYVANGEEPHHPHQPPFHISCKHHLHIV